MPQYVIGDVHGDATALENWLREINYNPDKDEIYSVGDLGDRGNRVKDTYEMAKYYGFNVVRSNHGDKIARLARGNPVKINAELADTLKQLGDDWREHAEWEDTLPYFLPFHGGFIIHGGCSPQKPIEEQSQIMLLMGRTWPFETYKKGKKAINPPWQFSYKGHLGLLIHGHHPSPASDWHENPNVISLDGGSVYGSLVPWGGKLRGVRLDDKKIFEVPGSPAAEAHYRDIWGDELQSQPGHTLV